MRVYIQSSDQYYRANLNQQQAERHRCLSFRWRAPCNNYAMVSCGLTVPDDLRASTLRRWINNGTAVQVAREEWQHSGCQSTCVLRGAQTCRW